MKISFGLIMTIVFVMLIAVFFGWLGKKFPTLAKEVKEFFRP